MIPLIQPPLADLGAIIQAIVFLVILASGAAKMFRESKDVQKQAERPRRQPRPRLDQEELALEADEPQMAKAGPAPQENIRSEVEEFLRRVGQDTEEDRQTSRPRQAQPSPRRRQPRIEVLEEGSGIEVDDRPRQTHRRQQPTSRPPETPTQQAAQGIQRGETVAQHVAEHLQRGEFAERASHMGEDLSQTDERLEARLHEKFDHGLGTLSARRDARLAADTAKRDVAASAPRASDILDLLTTPEGVQQAVILNEVLNRPADRW